LIWFSVMCEWLMSLSCLGLWVRFDKCGCVKVMWC
jgi:hypothetical protein